MERQPLYYTFLIFTILIGSCFYLSWAVDRGMGEVSVERLSIETMPGRSIELLVYAPRTANHYEPMPVMLTLHGLTGTKEGMYAFNIELARRNFTVVSIDLPGHGDSTTKFNITNFYNVALQAYVAVRHIQTTYPNVDNEIYGVLSHSLGFRVAIELEKFPIKPKAYVAVGDAGKLNAFDFVDFPGNLLFAIGEFDEIVTRQDALRALRFATGNESAQEEVTYGSFTNKTAYRLAFGPSNHIFETIDGKLVSEAIEWLVRGVQGESQLIYTRDPFDHVYQNKNIATFAGSAFLLISVIPVMWLAYSFLPDKLRPRRITINTDPFASRRVFVMSCLLGGGTILLFNALSLVGLGFEDAGIIWLGTMSMTGFILFLLVGTITLLIIMFRLMGRNDTMKSLSSVGIQRFNLKEHLMDILKNLLVASIGIVWFLIWLGLAGAPTHPAILLVLVKWPVGIRGLNILLLTILTVPFFLFEAAWIRGLLLNNREEGKLFKKAKIVLFAFFSKFALVALLTILTILGTTIAGVEGGRIVLIGVLWVRIVLVQLLATVIIIWSSFQLENTWSAVIMSSFILSLVVVTTLPLM